MAEDEDFLALLDVSEVFDSLFGTAAAIAILFVGAHRNF